MKTCKSKTFFSVGSLLTFLVCQSHICDTVQIGYPHSNPHPPM